MRPLDDLRGVDLANVYKAGRLAATLRRTEAGVVFEYVGGYLSDPGPAVATTLPVKQGERLTPAGALPPFFSGLLPEGRRLTALRRAVKTSADDELTLLLAVGGDLVGDVQVLPKGASPSEVEPRVAVDSWSNVSFAELLSQDSGQPIDRTGLAGVQDKVSAAMISVPMSRKDERFILKLDPPEYSHLVVNEAAMLDAARSSKLHVVSTDVVTDRERVVGLLVRRFDRTGPARLAVEDGCQVLGRYPADKYNVTTEQVCAALASLCDAPLVAAREFVRWVAFAYLSCNGDLHAKNLSIYQPRPGSWRVAPAYDLPSSYPYGDYTLALPINAKNRENVGRGDMLALGAALGVRPRAVETVLDELIAAVDGWLPLLRELPFDQHILRKWERAVFYRREQLQAS
jgi:serine/threonine-protein kinase HipA